jgi:hypothetical protein
MTFLEFLDLDDMKKIFIILLCLFFFLHIFVIPTQAGSDPSVAQCVFGTDPHPVISKQNSLTYGFNCPGLPDYIKNFSDRLPSQLYMYYPDVHCSANTLEIKDENTINNLTGYSLTRERGNTLCDGLLDIGTHGVQLFYKHGGKDELVSSGEIVIKEKEGSCDVNVTYNGNGTSDDPSWIVTVSSLSYDPQYNSLVVDLDNGAAEQNYISNFDQGVGFNIPNGPAHDGGDHTVNVYSAKFTHASGSSGGGGKYTRAPSPLCQTTYHIRASNEAISVPEECHTNQCLATDKNPGSCSGICAWCSGCPNYGRMLPTPTVPAM